MLRRDLARLAKALKACSIGFCLSVPPSFSPTTLWAGIEVSHAKSMGSNSLFPWSRRNKRCFYAVFFGLVCSEGGQDQQGQKAPECSQTVVFSGIFCSSEGDTSQGQASEKSEGVRFPREKGCYLRKSGKPLGNLWIALKKSVLGLGRVQVVFTCFSRPISCWEGDR